MDAHHARFLRWLAGVMLATAALSALAVLLVDPYGLYGWYEKAGINRAKPPLMRHQNEIKLARALRLQPRLVIVGNSRVEAGLDPDGPALQGTNAVNLGLAGTGTATAVSQLRYLAAQGIGPRHVVAGVDFVDALTAAPVGQAGPVPPLRVALPGRAWQADALLSAASLKDALRTVALQHDPEGPTATLRGFNPLREYHRTARVEGYAAIFRQREQENERKLARFAQGGLDVVALRAELRGLTDAAALGNPAVALDLLIYPYHAQLLAAFERNGLWPRFEAWKTVLVEEVAAARRRHPRARIGLVDFSGYGERQCEPVPAPGSGMATRWYWEAGHFKAALGEVMLARLLARGREGAAEGMQGDAGFGVPLEAANGMANRHRIAAERAACRARQPALFDGAARPG